jgi:hypothetical protein
VHDGKNDSEIDPLQETVRREEGRHVDFEIERQQDFEQIILREWNPERRVCPRSQKIGPAETALATGTPPSNRKARPPLVLPIGKYPGETPTHLVRKSKTAALACTADGQKPSSCTTGVLPAWPPIR